MVELSVKSLSRSTSSFKIPHLVSILGGEKKAIHDLSITRDSHIVTQHLTRDMRKMMKRHFESV